MKILFDQGTPNPLRQQLLAHSVTTAFEHGWSNLANGQLLDAAEQAGFDLLVTADRNLQYQQNLAERQIAVVVPKSTSWPRIQNSIAAIHASIARVAAGIYEEIDVPPLTDR